MLWQQIMFKKKPNAIRGSCKYEQVQKKKDQIRLGTWKKKFYTCTTWIVKKKFALNIFFFSFSLSVHLSGNSPPPQGMNFAGRLDQCLKESPVTQDANMCVFVCLFKCMWRCVWQKKKNEWMEEPQHETPTFLFPRRATLFKSGGGVKEGFQQPFRAATHFSTHRASRGPLLDPQSILRSTFRPTEHSETHF